MLYKSGVENKFIVYKTIYMTHKNNCTIYSNSYSYSDDSNPFEYSSIKSYYYHRFKPRLSTLRVNKLDCFLHFKFFRNKYKAINDLLKIHSWRCV